MNSSSIYYDPYPFEEFAPTLSQCFVIVIIGYLIARLEILSASDLKGVVAFASYFAMPGIICMSLADADFDDFRWELLVGIFLGKSVIFFAVSWFLIWLNGNIGVAGIVAIFCAQSNDLPVGNPLMSSLYKNHRPQMMKYLFLIPAMTVIFLVPFSNFMVRVHRARKDASRQQESKEDNSEIKKSLWQCLCKKENRLEICRVAKNPVFIATVLGLMLNVMFRGQMPKALHQPIQVAAATIPGIALAMLGFSFVRKERYLMSSAVVLAVVLLVLKMILTPILLHGIVKLLTLRSKSSQLLSDFSLLYGIISPATAVFQIGPEFRKPLAVMSVALILTSFGCFPVSYVVARITIAPLQKLSSYVPLLKHILFWTACASIFCDVLVWILLLLKKKNLNQVSCCYVAYLAFTQVLTCLGVLFWIFLERETWSIYCQMIFYYGGEISGYLWTGTLCIVLIFKDKYSLLVERRFSILCFTSFSMSALITCVMCVMIPYGDVQSMYVVERPRSNFEYLQLLIATIILFVSMTVVAFCLVHHFKIRKKTESEYESSEIMGSGSTIFYIQKPEETFTEYDKAILATNLKTDDLLGESDEARIYYDEIIKSSGASPNELLEAKDWTFRLSNLLILQGITMLVRYIANLFKLSHSSYLEIMIPIEFLQSISFIGQGIFILLTLGVDVRTPVISLKKWCRKLRHSNNEGTQNFTRDLDSKSEIAHFCNHFYHFYYKKCFQDIARNKRWKGVFFKDSFWGQQLVDWMITEGLCCDDADAESKGQKLLEGGVIEHVTRKHHFYDAPYLYSFVKRD